MQFGPSRQLELPFPAGVEGRGSRLTPPIKPRRRWLSPPPLEDIPPSALEPHTSVKPRGLGGGGPTGGPLGIMSIAMSETEGEGGFALFMIALHGRPVAVRDLDATIVTVAIERATVCRQTDISGRDTLAATAVMLQIQPR